MGLCHLQCTPIFYFMGPCFSVILCTTYRPTVPFMSSLTSISCTTHRPALPLYMFLLFILWAHTALSCLVYNLWACIAVMLNIGGVLGAGRHGRIPGRS